MDERMLAEIRQFVKSTTEKAATEDWTKAVSTRGPPIYNYRYDHVKEVVKVAAALTEGTAAEPATVEAAAWLHDAAKPGIGGVKKHAEASAELAFTILSEMEVDSEQVERICDVVRRHAGLTLDKKLEPIEAQIVWEADKLVKLGMTGFIHYILNTVVITPGKTLRSLSEDMATFLPLAERIAASMVTERAKKMAASRLDTLRHIAEALNTEIGGAGV